MSDWKQSAACRRDARHRGPVPHVRAASSKDTKRWCRGKPGVEHQLVARRYDEVKGLATLPSGRVLAHPNWWIRACAECGKELDRYWPLNFTNERGEPIEHEPPPAWVPVPPSGNDGGTKR